MLTLLNIDSVLLWPCPLVLRCIISVLLFLPYAQQANTSDYTTWVRSSISSVQSLGCVGLFATTCTAARQAFLCIINYWCLLKLMSMESVMPCNHLILCCPLVLLHSIPPETCCKLAFQLQSIIFYKVIKDKESTILNYDIYQKSKI